MNIKTEVIDIILALVLELCGKFRLRIRCKRMWKILHTLTLLSPPPPPPFSKTVEALFLLILLFPNSPPFSSDGQILLSSMTIRATEEQTPHRAPTVLMVLSVEEEEERSRTGMNSRGV